MSIALPQGSQPLDIDARLTIGDGVELVAVDSALPPTTREKHLWAWHLDDVVSPRPISVELPVSHSAPGHLLLLVRVSVLGLLLFCAGLWYASEGVRPGRADDIHLGGLLLLAFDYMSCYVLFAVVGHAAGPTLGTLCALASLPLLGLHVATLTDRRFAWRWALPLSLASHLLVFGLVYLDWMRLWLMLGASAAAVLWVTLTWRSWSASRTLFVQMAQEKAARSRHDEDLCLAIEVLVQRIPSEQRAFAQASERLLALGETATAPRARAQCALEEHEQAITQAKAYLHARDLHIDSEDSWRARAEREGMCCADVKEAQTALFDARKRLSESMAALEQSAREGRDAHAHAREELSQSLEELSFVCAEAAEHARMAPDSLRREIEADLCRGYAVQEEGRALFARQGEAPVLAVRQLSRSIVALLAHLRPRSAMLTDAIRASEAPALHCPACGATHLATGRFCPSCGIPRPVELPCRLCAEVNRFPSHLLRQGWQEHLHCHGCGTPLAASEDHVQGPTL